MNIEIIITELRLRKERNENDTVLCCLLYTSDAADEL